MLYKVDKESWVSFSENYINNILKYIQMQCLNKNLAINQTVFEFDFKPPLNDNNTRNSAFKPNLIGLVN